jgi:4'-phosphopantetheinyl transferase superfamily
MLESALTAAERRRVETLPAPSRWPLFLRYWTHKEAILKYAGTGLTISPTTVAVAPPGLAQWVQLGHPEDGRIAVWVSPLDVGDGYDGALASSHEFDAVVVRPVVLRQPARCPGQRHSRLTGKHPDFSIVGT